MVQINGNYVYAELQDILQSSWEKKRERSWNCSIMLPFTCNTFQLYYFILSCLLDIIIKITDNQVALGFYSICWFFPQIEGTLFWSNSMFCVSIIKQLLLSCWYSELIYSIDRIFFCSVPILFLCEGHPKVQNADLFYRKERLLCF